MKKRVSKIKVLVCHAKNTRGWNQEGKNRSLNASNLREEINCFERTGLNGLCPNIDLLPFMESKAIEGESRSTYWYMPAILNSLFFFSLITSYFLLFFSFVFTFFPSPCLLLGYGFFLFPEIPITLIFRIPFSVHSKGSFIEPAVTDIYCFSP